MHFTDSTRTHTESGAVDESLCLKPARFASGDRNIHWTDPSRCRPLRIAPGQTIRRAQIRDWMLKSDSGRMHRPHKAMPGYHSVAYPTENRRTKPFWNRPRPTLRTGSARFTDQIGNQMPDSEPVHGTPPDKDLRPVRHHRPHAPSRGIPTIPTDHHCLAQPGYSRRLARIENQPPISDSVQPLHRTQTSRQHHHQPETPEPSQSPTYPTPTSDQDRHTARTKPEIGHQTPNQSTERSWDEILAQGNQLTGNIKTAEFQRSSHQAADNHHRQSFRHPHPADQNGNQSPNSESVHETPPDKGHRLYRHHQSHHKTAEPGQSPYTPQPRGPQTQPVTRTKPEIGHQTPNQSTERSWDEIPAQGNQLTGNIKTAEFQ